MSKITLSNGTQFEGQAGQTILAAALSNGVSIEHSCKDGRCGVCKTRVLTGLTEEKTAGIALSDAERADGYVLTCCNSALDDIELEIEDLSGLEFASAQTLPCRIDSLTYLKSDVLEVILRTPPRSTLRYLSGQYIDVIGNDGLRRSYSLANAQQENGKLTLHIRFVENGKMSEYWFSQAKVNDLLRFEGPLGTFCLRKSQSLNLVLLATGTGIAPIKAIIEQILTAEERPSFENIYVYWGGRFQDDIYWKPDFPASFLKFVNVLSRDIDWTGRVGYVQQAVLEDNIDLSKSDVYACGSEVMIETAREQLCSAGLLRKNFFSDAFLSSI